MYRFSNVSYNGMLLSDICEVEEVILPVLPSRSISTLDISSRDGEIYNGKKYDSTEIELTVLIDCDTREEAKVLDAGFEHYFFQTLEGLEKEYNSEERKSYTDSKGYEVLLFEFVADNSNHNKYCMVFR